MIGFNLLNDLKKNPELKDELIAKAIQQIEESVKYNPENLATKQDVKDIELKISQLEIRLLNKMQINTWTIIGSIGVFGLLNHWIFK